MDQTASCCQPYIEYLAAMQCKPVPIPYFGPEDTFCIPAIVPVAVPIRDQDIEQYVRLELCTPKLDQIHKHLWYAGAPRLARPLHRHKLIGRELLVTEDVDEHLVWYQSRIFIKPLNRWLLDRTFWEENICPNDELYQAASGFLLSYIWLICYESDLEIGKESNLLPRELTWEQWTRLTDVFLQFIDAESLCDVAPRYLYCELRLARLNQIYRWVPAVMSGRRFVRGYLAPSTWYKAVFKENFGWLLAVFVYFTVALAALQLGLATETLQQSAEFQKASYGFTVFSVVFVVASVVVLLFTWVFLASLHYISANLYHRRVVLERRTRASV